jgi:hypothetical protein
MFRRLIADSEVSELSMRLASIKFIVTHNEEKLKSHCVRQVISTWNSFDDGYLRSHPGRAIWCYRIAEAFRDIGDMKIPYPASLSKAITEIPNSAPEGIPEYYGNWDNPIINWWP